MKKGLLLMTVLFSVALTGCATKSEPVKTIEASQDIVENDIQPKIISVQASRFQFSPSVITVKQGEKVALSIQDVDTKHGAFFMNMQTTTDTQGNIVLDTTTPGTYTFACATMCGHGHREMQGTVIIE